MVNKMHNILVIFYKDLLVKSILIKLIDMQLQILYKHVVINLIHFHLLYLQLVTII